LGIIVLTSALLLRPGAYLKKLVEQDESTNYVSSVRSHARRILIIYGLLTVIGIALIWIADGDFFNAVTHAFAAISTGGFSNFDHSLADFHSQFGAISVTIGCILGAVPLVLFFNIRQYHFSKIFEDIQVKTIICLIIFISIFFAWTLVNNAQMPIQEALYHAPLMVISAQTTAGFSSIDTSQIGAEGMLILMIAMVTGGAVGSTSGGIKLYRMLIFWNTLHHMLQKTAATPNAVIIPRLAGRNLETEEINKALLIILMFILTVTLAWLMFLFSGYEALSALFEVISATATVGLSSGITSVDLPDYLKLVLCICMLLGRLEFIALLVLAYPMTWLKRRSKA